MRKAFFSLITLISLTLFFNCIFDDVVRGKGIVVYLDFEGGFYGIVADDDKHYDPINLPEEYKEDSLRVRFAGKVREDLASFHMWGEIIELFYIERLE